MPADFARVLWWFDGLGLAVGLLVTWWFGRHSSSWWRHVRPLMWWGATLCVAAVLIGMAMPYHRAFAAICLLAHAAFCVFAPLLLIRGVTHLACRHRSFGIALLALGVLADGVWLWATRVEPFWLEVTRRELVTSDLPPGTAIKVVALADLQTDHIGDYEREVFAAMDRERADLILLPGDYLQVFDGPRVVERERKALAALFNGLEHRPRYGIWGVDGDVDDVAWTLAGTSVRPLHDEFAVLAGDPPLQILGLTTPASRSPLGLEHRARIASFDGLTIVMGHAPDFAVSEIEAFEGGGADAVGLRALCVAGHIHGGQVVIPFLGPPLKLSRIPRRYASGLSVFGPMQLFVSRGVGHERGYAPRIRLNCRPELAVLTLRGR